MKCWVVSLRKRMLEQAVHVWLREVQKQTMPCRAMRFSILQRNRVYPDGRLKMRKKELSIRAKSRINNSWYWELDKKSSRNKATAQQCREYIKIRAWCLQGCRKIDLALLRS